MTAVQEKVEASIDSLKGTFEQFVEANNVRFAELEAKGSADVLTEEKVDRINDEITTIMDALDNQAKEVARIRLTSSTSEIAIDYKNHAHLWLAAKSDKPVFDVTDEQVESYKKYSAAFGQFIRRGGNAGELLTEAMRNDLSVGSDPDGGFWVPAEVGEMVTKLRETSPMRSIATVQPITSDALELPIDHDEATSGGWVSELGTRAKSATPRIGLLKIPVHEQFAMPGASQKLLDDAVINVEAWLADKIADILGRTENTSFVTGDGDGRPRGFVSYSGAAVTTDDATRDWGVLQRVNSGASGGFPKFGSTQADDPGALVDIISKLNPQYRAGATFVMNRSTEALIRKLRDDNGRSLVGFGDIQDGALGFNLHGFPIVNFEDMADAASNSYSLAFGNFRLGYTIADRFGIRLLRDPFTSKPLVLFYSTKRVGGDVVNSDAIKLMKFAA